jgi:hypothetical protein
MNKEEIKNDIIKSGSKIIIENDFFRSLDNTMQNEEFRIFYSKYFKDYSDIKITIFYMKLYETIQKEYKEKNGTDIESEMLVFMMKELMKDNSSRKSLLNSFQSYIDGKNSNDKKFIMDIFEKKEKGNLIEWHK